MIEYVYPWAVYTGLFVVSCMVLSSMCFLLHYFVKAIFFWRYSKISEKMTAMLNKVMEDNREPDGNAELCYLAGGLLSIVRPEHFSRHSLQLLKEELQLDGNINISISTDEE